MRKVNHVAFRREFPLRLPLKQARPILSVRFSYREISSLFKSCRIKVCYFFQNSPENSLPPARDFSSFGVVFVCRENNNTRSRTTGKSAPLRFAPFPFARIRKRISLTSCVVWYATKQKRSERNDLHDSKKTQRKRTC